MFFCVIYKQESVEDTLLADKRRLAREVRICKTLGKFHQLSSMCFEKGGDNYLVHFSHLSLFSLSSLSCSQFTSSNERISELIEFLGRI